MAGLEKRDLKIPSSIKKYDLLTFDIPGMRKRLLNGDKITVRINGVPYIMDLHDSTGKAQGLDTVTRSYRGTLDSYKNGEIGFTIGEKSIAGRITIDGISYYFSTTSKTEKGKVLHYVYSSKDVSPEGQPAKWDNDYLGKKKIQALSPHDRVIAESKENSLEQKMSASGPVDVRILVIPDNQFISYEQENGRNWQTAAQLIMDEANTQLGRDYIEVNLIPIYDSSLASELSDDPQIIHTPLQTFINHVDESYLDQQSADLAIYLGGYDCIDENCVLGSTFGYDSNSRYAWAQMPDDPPSNYDGTDHDRTVVVLHEIGHLFDADHQDATGQNEDYNRAYQYNDGITSQTVVWAPFYPSNEYDYSSSIINGDAFHDNARRIHETRGIVSNYAEGIPIYYTITSTAGSGGTITPSGFVQIHAGNSQTFTIQADENYIIDSVMVDGGYELFTNPYTFVYTYPPVYDDEHSISATFIKETYTITASAGEGGTITPSGEVEVYPGESQTFVVQANEGYFIYSIIVDGNTEAITDPMIFSYTFPSTYEEGHSIIATFMNSESTIIPLCQAGTAFDATMYPQDWEESDPMTFSCTWDGNGNVYLSGSSSNLIGTYADDGLTIDTPNGIQFDAEGNYAQAHPPLDITNGMNPGSNTLTLIIRNYQGLSMSYGSSTGIGTDQVPYIIEVNDPTMIAAIKASTLTAAKISRDNSTLNRTLPRDTVVARFNSTGLNE